MEHEEKKMTKRACSSGIEKFLHESQKVLDHGFVRVVDYMGNDDAIVQSARVSYGSGTKKVSQDKALINYLMRHYHTTPFEMCEIKLHVKLPIFIARQWVRHRTASINEYSARYSILSKEFYIPTPNNLASQSDLNKQGRENTLDAANSKRVLDILIGDSERCYDHYTELLNQDEQGNIIDPSKQGLTRELARMNLTLNYYTEWYWKVNLHNLFHFLRLRGDSHAQYEIRAYAETILKIVKEWVPHAYEAFEEYRINSVSLSATALKAVKRMINGEKINAENSGLTKREWNEFAQIFNLNS